MASRGGPAIPSDFDRRPLEDVFLQSILEDPDDDAPRLV
jgi:hypothetical protein